MSILQEENNICVVHLSVEAAPYNKVGGLGDIVGSLPCQLNKSYGIQNLVITPLSGEADKSYSYLGERAVEFCGQKFSYMIYRIIDRKIHYYFIDMKENYSLNDYVDGSAPYLADVGMDYFFFSKCCYDFIETLTNKVLIITHDWHVAGIYLYLNDNYNSIHIIHNYQHQGQLFPDMIKYFDYQSQNRLNIIKNETGCISMSSLAVKYATRIVTVSENYAYELKNKLVAHPGLDVFEKFGREIIGIINGIDADKWDPKQVINNTYIPYSGKSFYLKAENKKSILQKYNLDQPERPLLLLLSRLVYQKGIDLFVNMHNRRAFSPVERMKKIVEKGYNIIICGVPGGGAGGEVDQQMRLIQKEIPHNFRYLNYYTDNMAMELLAASDMLLHVSNYEPCGLVPMYAMRFGTVPIVSKVGGMADYVEDNKNGFFVERMTYQSLISALEKVKNIYEQKVHWTSIVQECMLSDHTWKCSLEKYVQLIREVSC